MFDLLHQSQIFICPMFTKIESNIIIPYGAAGALDKPLQVGLMLNCTFRKEGLEVNSLQLEVHLKVHVYIMYNLCTRELHIIPIDT